MSASDEEYYEVPLKDQKYFGAGIKRKRVHFVPSTANLPSTKSSNSAESSASARYLAVVFSRSPSADVLISSQPKSSSKNAQTTTTENTVPLAAATETPAVTTCDICKAPLSLSDMAKSHHTASLVHQICLPHSHPPSHLDRTRLGMSILGSHGWDPDSRRGLGSSGEGILHPVKAREKRDTLGLGHGKSDDEEEAASKLKRKKKATPRPEPKKLHAGAVRKMYDAEKRKDNRLRDLFYANEDVERYLGGA